MKSLPGCSAQPPKNKLIIRLRAAHHTIYWYGALLVFVSSYTVCMLPHIFIKSTYQPSLLKQKNEHLLKYYGTKNTPAQRREWVQKEMEKIRAEKIGLHPFNPEKIIRKFAIAEYEYSLTYGEVPPKDLLPPLDRELLELACRYFADKYAKERYLIFTEIIEDECFQEVKQRYLLNKLLLSKNAK